MQLEEGKFYLGSDGKRYGPVEASTTHMDWCIAFPSEECHYRDGSSVNGNDPDLIAKWTDEPETVTVSRVTFEDGYARVCLSNGAELSGVVHAEAEAIAGDITRAGLVVKVG